MNVSSKVSSDNDMPRFRVSRKRRTVWFLSCLAILISIIGFFLSSFNPSIGAPLKPGLDFTGGTQITFDRECLNKCDALNSAIINKALSEISFENENVNQNLSGSKVQLLDGGESLVIRLPFLSVSQANKVLSVISPLVAPFKQGSQSIATIGPTLGAQLLRSSLISLVVAFCGIAFYISIRYDKIYALLALLALAHDVIIVCGVFSWLGIIYGIEVDSLFAVSLLTIAGYSVNDTVVVFDRIRQQNKNKALTSSSEKIDKAVSATLTRTLYTSGTTLLPLMALIFFGGTTLYWFSISLALGVVIGSWSSIALAPSLLSLKESTPVETLTRVNEITNN